MKTNRQNFQTFPPIRFTSHAVSRRNFGGRRDEYFYQAW
jgi:hypothetical protein